MTCLYCLFLLSFPVTTATESERNSSSTCNQQFFLVASHTLHTLAICGVVNTNTPLRRETSLWSGPQSLSVYHVCSSTAFSLSVRPRQWSDQEQQQQSKIATRITEWIAKKVKSEISRDPPPHPSQPPTCSTATTSMHPSQSASR